MRAVIAPMVADRSFYEAIPGLAEAVPAALRDSVAGCGWRPEKPPSRRSARRSTPGRPTASWCSPAVAPTIPHHCSDEFILGCAGLARDFAVGLHSHVAESKVQAVASVRLYGKTQTAHLDALGVLGPHFVVAHGVWLDEDDMARLGDHGASVAHNPGSNMRLGSGLADTRAMLDRRVNLGIGTDGASCADNQNMYEAMRLASFASKVQGPEWQRWLTTREAALAATEGSARALGLGDRIGRIAPGWKADLVLLDLDHPNWLPLNDPVNQLVHCEDGTAVDTVMIGGRVVVQNRRPAGIDLAALRARAEAARERLAAINADSRRLYAALEPVVGSYCPGLARSPTTSTATARRAPAASRHRVRAPPDRHRRRAGRNCAGRNTGSRERRSGRSRCRGRVGRYSTPPFRASATSARSGPSPEGPQLRSPSSPTARRSPRPTDRDAEKAERPEPMHTDSTP